MNNKNTLLLITMLLGLSSMAFAKNRHNDHYNGHNNHSNHKHGSQHRQKGDRPLNKHNNNRSSSYNRNYNRSSNNNHRSNKGYSNKHRSKHKYNNGHNGYRGFNSPYRSGHQNSHRNYNNRSHRYYRNNHRNYSYNNRYYYNYRPYYEDRYRYRPLRGLGHYFLRTGYGYGHWHDNSWCVVNHPQSYYYDYYSNYPYQNGWIHGDGDFGISFYFD
ncbi:MAG: hypothetical protein AB8B80_01180 [Marinicellaceae bacterium]